MQLGRLEAPSGALRSGPNVGAAVGVASVGRGGSEARVVRGNADYGFVLNVSANSGFRPEGRVSITYQARRVALGDGTTVELRAPLYRVDSLDGPPLRPDTVLMPRLPPAVQGDGLLEMVPAAELERVAQAEVAGRDGVRGQVAWVEANTGNVPLPALAGARARGGAAAGRVAGSDTAAGAGSPGRVVGRFGWQASEPTVGSQVAVAFAREMGLTNLLEPRDDCAPSNSACKTAPSGGSPEVERGLFDAVVNFQSWHAVPVTQEPDLKSPGAWLFESTGCGRCHQTTLAIDANTVIHPFTDLLLHDMGQGLADRTIAGAVAPSRWRTAPLWGMHAAAVATQAQHFLHDGRARTIAEAVMWHDGEGRTARDRFANLSADQRRTLTAWVNTL